MCVCVCFADTAVLSSNYTEPRNPSPVRLFCATFHRTQFYLSDTCCGSFSNYQKTTVYIPARMYSKLALQALISKNNIIQNMFNKCPSNASQCVCKYHRHWRLLLFDLLARSAAKTRRVCRICTWDCTRYDAYHANSLSLNLCDALKFRHHAKQSNIDGGNDNDPEQKQPKTRVRTQMKRFPHFPL